MHHYREKELQLAAVAWMQRHWAYREVSSDPEATGARMDTAGYLQLAGGAEELIAIEVKPAVVRNMAWHAEGRSGSIEAKIAATLRELYGESSSGRMAAFCQHWDRASPVSIGVLAGRYSEDGGGELVEMLDRRSREWVFRYRVLVWADGAVRVVARGDDIATPDALDWPGIAVPHLVGQQKRARTPSIEELDELAAARGVGELFRAARDLAVSKGFRIQRRPSGIALSQPAGSATVISLFLGESDADSGINTGIWAEGLAIAAEALPGRPAPRAGYLNTNRFIGDPMEFGRLFDLAAASRPRPPVSAPATSRARRRRA